MQHRAACLIYTYVTSRAGIQKTTQYIFGAQLIATCCILLLAISIGAVLALHCHSYINID